MAIFLFTDIEGSTGLWQKYPDQMGQILARHDALLRQLVDAQGGKVVKHTGDGIFAVFEGGDPLECALQIQITLGALQWEVEDAIRVRVALHTGAAIQRNEDYFGLDVNRTARLLSAGWGGQILLTQDMRRLNSLPVTAELIDLGVHTLKDLSEPQHIYQLDSPRLPLHEFPALHTLSGHPHNLPPQPTLFIGRMNELGEIKHLLTGADCRLLTLVGLGGIGKTRLALQSAAELVEFFPHGVYFVPLAALPSGNQLIPAIAEALKLNFYLRETPIAQLLNYLREKKLLLVLDNFEHLVESASLVAEILSAAAQLRILVTSRERLNLREEQILSLAGLRQPAPGSTENLESYSSARLFLQSAHRVRPEFNPSAEEGSCVARICRLVEGIPLCLELAANWLRMLSCREIAVEIETSLDILETQLRDVPQRHRSLRAVFDYSWVLLNDAERVLLPRLAVFRGPFNRVAAEAVSGFKKQSLLASLTGLVDKSLLRHNPNGDYELHSLMRQYALEHLEAAPADLRETRNRHAAYFTRLIAGHQAELEGDNPRLAMDEITHTFDDLLSAWLWAAEQNHLSEIVTALPATKTFLTLRARSLEGRHLLEVAIAAAEKITPVDEVLLLRLRLEYATFCANLYQHAEAEALLLRCLADAQRLPGQAPEATQILILLGNIANLRGEYAKSGAYYSSALEICRTLPDPTRYLGEIFDHLGSVAWTTGDSAGAHAYFEQALQLARQHGKALDIALYLDHLGVSCRDMGRCAEAQQHFIESVGILEPLDARYRLSYGYNHLGGIFLMLEQTENALHYYEKSNLLAQETGERRIRAYNLLDMATLYHALPDGLERARECAQESAALFTALGEPFGIGLAQAHLAGILFECGAAQQAWNLLLNTLDITLQTPNNRVIYLILSICGTIYAQLQNWSRAVTLLTHIPEHLNTEYNMQQQLETFRSHLSAEEYQQAQTRAQQLTLAEVREWIAAEIAGLGPALTH